jgi:hypothetical protein
LKQDCSGEGKPGSQDLPVAIDVVHGSKHGQRKPHEKQGSRQLAVTDEPRIEMEDEEGS